jgi:Acyl-CoA reductase (LuxC).
MTDTKIGDTLLRDILPGELVAANVESITDEIRRLEGNVQRVSEIPLRDTVALLDKCAKMWQNRDYSRRHIEILSRITNQSPELVTMEIEETMKMLLSCNIMKTIKCELGESLILDGWVSTNYGKVRRKPRGIVFHNISGNALVVIPVSISMGLISKNCNLVKVSKDEPYFAYALYKSLYEIDKTISQRLAITYFDSSHSDIYERVVCGSNCVMHWGGLESAKYIAGLCSKYQVKLITHGPKVSFEVVDDLEGDYGDVASKVAMDMMAWEQKACLSPRIVFINRKLDSDEFSRQLANALQTFTKKYPKAYANEWNSIKTIQDRQYCIEKYGLQSGIKVYSSYNADYTVLQIAEKPQKEDIDRCFYRFIFVCPYQDSNEVVDWVTQNIKPYLQTMGYAGSDESFLDKMALLGVTIITKPGEMTLHAPGTSHDGLSNLTELTYAISRQF